MKYTVGQAAKLVGRAKSTISKECRDGTLSHEKSEDGSFQIDASELRRVYPEAFDETGAPTVQADSQAVASNDEETASLRLEVAVLRERLRSAETASERERELLLDEVRDLRERLDLDGQERRKLTAILTDQRAMPAPREGLFARLFGGRREPEIAVARS